MTNEKEKKATLIIYIYIYIHKETKNAVRWGIGGEE